MAKFIKLTTLKSVYSDDRHVFLGYEKGESVLINIESVMIVGKFGNPDDLCFSFIEVDGKGKFPLWESFEEVDLAIAAALN